MTDDIVKDFLIESFENLIKLDQDFISLEKHPENTELLDRIFRTVHTIKGTAGFLNFKKLVKVAHIAEEVLSKIRERNLKADPPVITALLKAIDAIKTMLASIEKNGNDGLDEYEAITARLKQVSSLPMPSPDFASVNLTDFASQMQPGAKAGSTSTLNCGVPPAPEQPDSLNSQVGDSTIRVEVALLDRLMNLVGELVLARNQILQFSQTIENKAIQGPSQRLNLIATELQENVMKTRMQPIGGVWSKLPRLVRDVATATGKDVDLQMEGAETELDKTILEAVRDPFTHIVRNAIDHGIESPEQRVLAGKPRKSVIRLRAYHEGGQVNIEVSDDGTGIDISRVKRKAIQQGLINEEQALRMNDREAMHLVFRPGFSTAEQVTAISGRGVGMDVVKSNIEKIGGIVDLVNQPGQGTVVKIKIPLTLAIIPALIVTASSEKFAIPQINLRELVRLEGEQAGAGIEWIQGVEVYRLRGNLLPLLRLRDVLKLPASGSASDAVNIVVLSADNRLFGLIVDGINDTEEIVVKPLAKQLAGIQVFAGSTIMGDGHVALILDVVGIAQNARMLDENIEHRTLRDVSANDGAHIESAELLLFTIDARNRCAMPLSTIARLEEFPFSGIERSGDHDVIQYRGQVMPLIYLAKQLGLQPSPARETVPVIVFTHADRFAGMVVDRILDVVQEKAASRRDVDRRGLMGSAIIQEHTTTFIDAYAIIEDALPGFFSRSTKSSRNLNGDAPKNAINRRILLVEDSSFFRGLERSYLDLEGYRVLEASNGVEALEKLKTQSVDMVVSDIDMPELNGYELAARIRSDPNLKQLPLLALSSLDSAADVARGKAAGFDDYQIKVDRDKLLAVVERMLEHAHQHE